MYSLPANSSTSPRVVGAMIASVVTTAAIYATLTSHGGFGQSAPKPVDFRNSMTSESGGGEPDTIMVPDTSIPGSQASDEPSENLVREGPDSSRVQTLLPATESGANLPSWRFSRKPSRISTSGPDVVQPALQSSTRAGFPQLSLTAREAGVTTMSYCVTVDGLVRDAKVSVSSGYKRLDAAAVDWLNARDYKPGTIKGVPAEMCGLIDYQWRLNAK